MNDELPIVHISQLASQFTTDEIEAAMRVAGVRGRAEQTCNHEAAPERLVKENYASGV